MQITINQSEIERAILEYMHKRISITEGTEIEIEMKATRGSEGFSAIIDIMDDDTEELNQKEKERVTKQKEEKLEEAGRFLGKVSKKESADKPEESSEDVGEDDTEDEPAKEAEPAKPKAKNPKSIFGNVVKG